MGVAARTYDLTSDDVVRQPPNVSRKPSYVSRHRSVVEAVAPRTERSAIARSS
ncbi:hypothetical protein [Streptomyces niveus]|uniref:hypothetical protein n=1 Tax=Streptomyces niveus TaxID=193462 RepID=UPI0036469E92